MRHAAFASRRRLLGWLGSLGAAPLLGALPRPAQAAAQVAPQACDWPLYRQFLARLVQDDGRVIDPSTPEQHSTSEGQSYGMVFALIANDRATFDRLWQWSVANLGAGDLATRLPAWRWGRRSDGSWGVIDANSASDADLWFAYALLEGARLWKQPRYATAARALLKQVAAQEVGSLPGFGTMLLPGPQGFMTGGPKPADKAEAASAAKDDGKGGARSDAKSDAPRQWRLNASYLPVPVLRRLAAADGAGPWATLAVQAGRFITAVARQGIVPDWSAYASPGGFGTDAVKGDVSSYDAIRVYLWSGMTPRADAAGRAIRQALAPHAQRMAGLAAPPERMHADSGALEGEGPLGFSAALLPFLAAAGSSGLAAQRSRAQGLADPVHQQRAPATYYDTVLGLFGLGYDEGRYRFAPSGQLELQWEKACRSAAAK
ncbi:endo-1,4-D-glucanase [Cupriavidus sp. USMAHM13]|uniref:endoglucanase n=1 Tax=Cupriavidus sp. USMAHM13 TaxID=1389192 RepID=UPI0008A6BD1C|nr:endoglucanase [Cupriavidus sp. USMAHM13]AOZ03349.1 endo-1,4-D-glucanase [Cupriavidus sp. USMAHM13]